jgi:prepilin-type processing-associated H-X9-DG protein
MGSSVPSGGNSLFLDGHVGWRKYRTPVPTIAEPSRNTIMMMYNTNDRDVRFWY